MSQYPKEIRCKVPEATLGIKSQDIERTIDMRCRFETKVLLLICMLFSNRSAFAQTATTYLDKSDLAFLQELTKVVIDSSRIRPGQTISSDFGPNASGGTLIRPGGRDDYPAFWIRDYAMSLESGLIPVDEQKHMLLLTASTQCEQTWITQGGSMVPVGSIADHIRIDDLKPIYFPGTYSYKDQGNKYYGVVPPFCDQFYFVQMAYSYVKASNNKKVLMDEIHGMNFMDRLELAFSTPPARPENHIVFTTEEFRGVDFGFRDGIQITGDLCFPSILKYKAAKQLSELFDMLDNPEKSKKYDAIAAAIKNALPTVFLDRKGMLKASTGWSSQPDVWATSLAVYFGLLEGEILARACNVLAVGYAKGSLAYKGSIRHILTTDDFNGETAWEKTEVGKNRYQNGAYWSTPTGWVCYAIAQVDKIAARRLAKDFIDDLRENDFRKGPSFGAPYECFHAPAYKQNPVYMTSVTCPYAVFK